MVIGLLDYFGDTIINNVEQKVLAVGDKKKRRRDAGVENKIYKKR